MGNKHYFEIVCGVVDEFYGPVDYKLLNLTQINFTVQIYTSVDIYSRPMANCPIGGFIELVQNCYHKMNF